MEKLHLLVVGDPGDGITLLRRQFPSLEITVLCRSALIAVQPTLAHADRVLATGPVDETVETWIATAVAVHTVSPVGLVAAVEPGAYCRAAMIADVLGTGLYPRAGFGGIADRWRTRQRLVVAGYDAGAAACVRDFESLERFIAEHGIPCYVRSRTPDSPVTVLRGYRDVDRLIDSIGRLGSRVVAELVPGGDTYLVALAVDSAGAEPVAVLPRGSSPPAASVPARDGLADYARGVAAVLDVHDGVLIVDLAVCGDKVVFEGATLGVPGGAVHAEILQVAGTDIMRVCVAQLSRLLAPRFTSAAARSAAADETEGGPSGDHDVR
jgi:hypothetical protein